MYVCTSESCTFDPRGKIDRICKDYDALLQTKYKSSRAHFRDEDILCCFCLHGNNSRANDSWGGTIFDPIGITGRNYLKLHLILLLHNNFKSIWSCGFREDFLRSSNFKPVADNDAP